MRDKIILLILACTMVACTAQTKKEQPAEQAESTEVYDMVDDMPRFPGGTEALAKFLSENMEYPADALKEGVGGQVMVEFVIDKDGNVTDPTVVTSVHPLLDSEAVRVVKAMPRWIAGQKDGKPVNVKFTLPVAFSLDNGTKDTGADKK